MRAIYRGLKQVFETLFSGNGSELSSRRPGRIPVAGDVVDRADLAGAKRRTRQPAFPGRRSTSRCSCPARRTRPPGFFFYVPKSNIIEIEMSTEDAATLIMSCGVVQPGSDAAEKRSSARRHGERAQRYANATSTAAVQPSARTPVEAWTADGQ